MNALLLTLLLAGDPQKMEWKINDVSREALGFGPWKHGSGAPLLVFGFHCHGGSMQQASRSFPIHELWPEAVVVYPQGLPTAGKLTDPEGKRSGWPFSAGEHEHRDFKLFDAILATLKEKYKIDEKRVYCAGHSNGGAFTYLLWANRPDVFAAIAPSAAPAPRTLKDAKPCPIFHVAGEKDQLVNVDGPQ